jgi:hypothetical protein
VYERDKVCGADETEITCLECDQRFFIAALRQIILEKKRISNSYLEKGYSKKEADAQANKELSLDALMPFQEAAGRIIRTGHFPEGNSLKPCSGVESCLMTFEPNRQQFSTFVMGIIGHNLTSFLIQDSTNIDRIGLCRNCGDFFIKHDLRMVNCTTCRGKETPEALRERQQKCRYNKNIEYSKLYDRGIKFGLNHAEVESRLEYWINESGCKFSDVLSLPDTTIFSFK